MNEISTRSKKLISQLTSPQQSRQIERVGKSVQLLSLIDATASMTGYLDAMTSHARNLLERMSKQHRGIGMSCAFYRDHDCVNPFDFYGGGASHQGSFVGRSRIQSLQDFLKTHGVPEGNQTTVEAMGAAMFHASSMPWSATNRVIVHAGDQPSHGYKTAHGMPYSEGDSLDHCQLGMSHRKILECLKAAGVRCYMVRCGHCPAAEQQYRSIAKVTGGRFIDFAKVSNAQDFMIAIEAAMTDATGGNARRLIERHQRTNALESSTVRALLESFPDQEGGGQ